MDFKEQLQYIPLGVNTLSKSPARYIEGVYPKQVIEGSGSWIKCEDHQWYLDYVCSLGPILLGHKNAEVDNMVVNTIREHGTIFTLSHPLEGELAKLIHEVIPSCEMSRFGHNGVDATSAAVRLARAITGREKILSFSYHGAADWYLASQKCDAGVPKAYKKHIKEFDYNENIKKDILSEKYACVILEPHTIRMPDKGWLEGLREYCTRSKTILIFDEVVSGFRYPGYSAQAYFKVSPDITCLSKGIANGYPLSVVGGREKYMKHFDSVFYSTTFGGNLVGVSAAIATIGEIVKYNVPTYLDSVGRELKIPKNPYVKLTGLPWRQFFEFKNKKTRAKFMQGCVDNRIFFGVPIFFNFAHTHHEIEYTNMVMKQVVKDLPKIKLRGKPPRDVFKKR